ncbi:MAG: hypothetical protein WB424_10365 [Terracidiphilus sp.]
MKTGIRDQGSGVKAAEETLRLIARLHAPDGLEERLQESLQVAALAAPRGLRWPAWLRPSGGWMRSAPLRAAAATAIVAVVVGGGWIVSWRLPAAQTGMAVTASPRCASAGGFSSAGAMRTPQTLDRPLITAPAEAAPAKVPSHPKGKNGAKGLRDLGTKGLRD